MSKMSNENDKVEREADLSHYMQIHSEDYCTRCGVRLPEADPNPDDPGVGPWWDSYCGLEHAQADGLTYHPDVVAGLAEVTP